MASRSYTEPANLVPEQLEVLKSAFLSGATTYGDLGSGLYRVLCSQGAQDEFLLGLASNAQQGAQPAFHLLASVHFLLIKDPSLPLAGFYATLRDHPAAPDDAFPEFAAFCRAHRDEILQVMATRTVQTSYVERCGILMPLISAVAQAAGEPLNLIEVGCSAGILLTFDKYSYELPDGRSLGPQDAPLTVSCVVEGGPEPKIPSIGTRIGLDLHPLDMRDEDDRHWLIALSIPELRKERERLLAALDVVAVTPMRLIEGDAVNSVESALGEVTGPTCVFHSACMSYWPHEARMQFEDVLLRASLGQDIYRVGIEAPAQDYAWHKGTSGPSDENRSGRKLTSELSIARYRNGQSEGAVIAQGPIFGPFDWRGFLPW